MKDQPRNLNQTWSNRSAVVSIYKCPSLLKNWVLHPVNLGCKNIKFLTIFLRLSHLTTYLRNETLRQQTKMLASVYGVFPKSWLIFCDFWPRNGWDPLAHCDPPHRRPLRYNDHSCDMSSCCFVIYIFDLDGCFFVNFGVQFLYLLTLSCKRFVPESCFSW